MNVEMQTKDFSDVNTYSLTLAPIKRVFLTYHIGICHQVGITFGHRASYRFDVTV